MSTKDSQENLNDRMLRLAAEQKAAEKKAKEDANSGFAQQRQADEEKDRSDLRKFFGKLSEGFPSIVEGIIKKRVPLGTDLQLSFCIFAYVIGDASMIKQELKVLEEAIKASGMQPIVGEQGSGKVIRGEGSQGIVGHVQSVGRWDDGAKGGAFLTLAIRPQTGGSTDPQFHPREIGWVEPKNPQDPATYFHAKYSTDGYAVGVRWSRS